MNRQTLEERVQLLEEMNKRLVLMLRYNWVTGSSRSL